MKGKFYAGKRTGSETDPYRASMEIKKKENWRAVCFFIGWIPDSPADFITFIFIIFVSTFAKSRNLEVEYYIPAEEERCNFKAVNENQLNLFL